MEIRRLTVGDYAELARLWSKADLPYKPRGRDSEESIDAQMKASPDFFVGAFENGQLVGSVILSCDLRRGWMNRLAVDPDCRRRGVAKALVDMSEKILRRHGIRIFCALIDEANIASRDLFKKCGYVEHSDILYFSKRDSDSV